MIIIVLFIDSIDPATRKTVDVMMEDASFDLMGNVGCLVVLPLDGGELEGVIGTR